jgi:hypothetical protein
MGPSPAKPNTGLPLIWDKDVTEVAKAEDVGGPMADELASLITRALHGDRQALCDTYDESVLVCGILGRLRRLDAEVPLLTPDHTRANAQAKHLYEAADEADGGYDGPSYGRYEVGHSLGPMVRGMRDGCKGGHRRLGPLALQ